MSAPLFFLGKKGLSLHFVLEKLSAPPLIANTCIFCPSLKMSWSVGAINFYSIFFGLLFSIGLNLPQTTTCQKDNRVHSYVALMRSRGRI